MKPSVMTLIDYLISLSEDDNSDISFKARNVLIDISNNFTGNHNIRLTSLLEEKFYSFLARLPTIIRWSSKFSLLTIKM